MSSGFRKVVAVIVGIILALGIIVSFQVDDNTIHVMVALLAVLYAIYLMRLSRQLKEEKKKKGEVDSPLRRR